MTAIDADPVRVAFVDFWPGSERHVVDNASALSAIPGAGITYAQNHASVLMLMHALAAHREVVVVEAAEADIVFFSVFGATPPSFTGTAVYVTLENFRPLWSCADFFIGFDVLDRFRHSARSRFLRLPSFAFHKFEDDLQGFEPPPAPAWAEREFCNFIYTVPRAEARRILFDQLNAYRPVTSPGLYRTNTAAPELAPRKDLDWRRSKILYQSRFRFTITTENSSFPGYTSEKLYDALAAGTIPIYWGNPLVAQDFDERAFVNSHSFVSLDDVVEHVRRIDADPDLAAAYLSHRDFFRTQPSTYFERLVTFLDGVVEHARRQRARGGLPLSAARVRANRTVRARLHALRGVGAHDERGSLHGQDRQEVEAPAG